MMVRKVRLGHIIYGAEALPERQRPVPQCE
jgi:hypothetical protein